MMEFERTTITMKTPFHKKISFGGSQTTEGALDFFRKLRSKDEYHMRENYTVIRVLEKAKRFGCERLTFWIQNNQMHITFEFEKVLDASLFIKLIS